MKLSDGESIILRIGDLKLSDTFSTFGKKKEVNGILYLPCSNPKRTWHSQIGSHLAHGHSREGLAITNDKAEIYLTYGSSRLGSIAQSMAIGYHGENGYFFVDEYFQNIFSATPVLSSRNIVIAKSLFEPGGMIKGIYLSDSPDYKAMITKEDKMQFEILLSKIRALEKAFSKENLNELRKR